jgi:hypothetical protein
MHRGAPQPVTAIGQRNAIRGDMTTRRWRFAHLQHRARRCAVGIEAAYDRRTMFRFVIRTATALALTAGFAAHAEGLRLEGLHPNDAPAAATWPRWQARLGVVGPAGGPRVGAAIEADAPRAAALLGDYYFTGSGFDPQRVGGGLRATTGWLYGGGLGLEAGGTSTGNAMSASFWRSGVADEARMRHAGYIGIGYTGLVPRLGLGFSADLGLIGTSLSPTGARLESDYTIRDVRLAPTVRLGMSYAF